MEFILNNSVSWFMNLLLFFILYYVYVCALKKKPERGIGSPEAEDKNVAIFLMWVLGTEFWFPEKA